MFGYQYNYTSIIKLYNCITISYVLYCSVDWSILIKKSLFLGICFEKLSIVIQKSSCIVPIIEKYS